jgi:hypothetical protein
LVFLSPISLDFEVAILVQLLLLVINVKGMKKGLGRWKRRQRKDADLLQQLWNCSGMFFRFD